MGKTMSRDDLKWILRFAGILVLVTSFPYFLGFANSDSDWVFSGFVFGVNDGNSYIAKMLSGSYGAWLFKTPYSSMDQRGVIAYLPYLLLGKLASGDSLQLQLLIIFHLFRIISIPFLIMATYRFVSLFIESTSWRRWTTILVTCGGGLGWLLALTGNASWQGDLPLDFYSPESFGFLSIYGLPHLILARFLLLTGMVNYLRAAESPQRGWIAGVCFFVLPLVQPLSIVTAFAVIGVHQLILLAVFAKRRSLKDWKPWLVAALRSGVLALPLVIYLGISFTQDPFLKRWTEQNRILSPHPGHYLFAYGILLIPMIAGIRNRLRLKRISTLLPLSWIVAFPFLAYAPHNLQRRLPEGVWVAVVLFAAIGFSEWKIERRVLKLWVPRVVLICSLLSSVVLILGGIRVAMTPEDPVFRPAEEVKAFNQVAETVESGSVVLTGFDTGNALPAYAPVFVVIGHGPESADLEFLEPQVEAFYQGMMDESRAKTLLDDWNVDYIWFGPRERHLGTWHPSESFGLEMVLESGEYVLYRVLPESIIP
jgi:hypothetical protein